MPKVGPERSGVEPQYRDPYDNEALCFEARNYLADVKPLGIIGETSRLTRAYCDVAEFGHQADITIAFEGLEAVVENVPMSYLTKPSFEHGDTSSAIGNFADLAVELDGEHIVVVKQAADMLFPKHNSTARGEILLKLCESGRADIIEETIQEVSKLPEALSLEKMEWLLTLGGLTQRDDVTTYGVALTRDLETKYAIWYLAGTNNDNVQTLAEIVRRFEETEWEQLDIDYRQSTEERQEYITQCGRLFQLTGDEKYKQMAIYYLAELPDDESKLSALCGAADYYEKAPEDILEIAKKIAPDGQLTDWHHALLAFAYSSRKNFEQAVFHAEQIKADRVQYIKTYRAMIRDGAYHLSEKVIEIIYANSKGQNTADFDTDLAMLSDELLDGGFVEPAAKIVDFMQDPAQKIQVLRNIARVNEGKKPRI